MEKSDANKRNNQGKFASIIGLIANIFIAGAKIVVGALFGVISVLADGLNNLMDCGNNIISTVSFKLSSKPADKEHPYGHERTEYVCALAVAFLVLMVAFTTITESIDKILNPTDAVFSFWIISALGLSILVKFGLYFFYRHMAKKLDSDMLKASAVDCLTDCISTVVVGVSLIIGKFAGVNIDGYAGIIVGLFIAWSVVGILKEVFSKLIGQAPDKAFTDEIVAKIKAYDGVLDVHDLAVYSYGPNKYFASVHVEVDAKVDVLKSHELIDDIERDFIETTNIVLTGHLDPVVVDNPVVNSVKERVCQKIKELNQELSIHDFRMVFGERHTNVLFDVALPFGVDLDKAQIVEFVNKTLCEIDSSYRGVITVEHCI